LKNTIKRLLIFLIVLSLIFAFVACDKTGEEDMTDDTKDATETESMSNDDAADDAEDDSADAEEPDKLMHGTVDLSKQADIVYYHLGDDKEDMQMVLDFVNENILLPELNSTLDVKFLPWSDWKTQYGLTLQGGTQVDLIYTSDWAYYSEESAKGAFRELTMDFIEDTMPLTFAQQAESSWTEVKIGGKIFAIPQSRISHNHGLFVIRDDLRVKYGLEPVETMEDFEAYLYKVAEEGEVIPYNADKDDYDSIIGKMYEQVNPFVPIDMHFEYIYPGNDDSASLDDVFYKFEDPGYLELLYKMKDWADAGIIPKNALNNDVSVEDSFDNGQSAMLGWNLTVLQHGKNLRMNNPDWVPAYVEFANFYLPMKYSNDCIAITTVCDQPERAAVVLDYMKFDPETSFILRTGLEGVHYEIDGKYYIPDEEAIQRYPTDSWTWATRPTMDYFLGEVPGFYASKGDGSVEYDLEQEFQADWISKYTASPKIRSFKFDESPVKGEVAAMDAIIQQYVPALQFGLVDDVDASYQEFMDAMKKAGLETFKTEYLKQLQAYIDSNY
jgi:ABC-type glycerol-3-phosphate transport system substrate-binding protein